MTLLLSAADLARCLEPADLRTSVERGFAAYSGGETETPQRLALSRPEGVVLTMPGAVARPPALGVKVVSVFPANRERGLPTLTSLYLLLDPESGAALAVADGTHLTAARTAAASAVATDRLARPEAATLGVFGTGVQARFHVEALRRVRPFARVLVAGTSRQKEEAFARWVRERAGLDAAPATPNEASAADVVAACTTSPAPVVLDAAVRPGAHLNAVGAFTPRTRELPGALVARARVYVDTRAGALAEAGDLLIPAAAEGFSLDAVAGEIGEVVLERVPARRDASEITVYKSVGAAFLDAVAARLAYDRARAAGIGQEFAFTA